MEVPPALPTGFTLPPIEVQRIKDAEHLRLLGIGYYIVGAFTVLFGCFGLMYVAMGLLMFSGAFPPNPPPRPPHAPPVQSFVEPGGAAADAPVDAGTPRPTAAPFSPDRPSARARPPEEFPRGIGLLFAGLGGVFVLIGWTVGGLTIYAGRCLHQRKHRTLTMIMAGLNCLQIPFGTALGIATFLVLQRPTVEALYRQPPGPVRPSP